MDEQRVAEGNPQTIMTFMTTEHFNLQSARAAANSEISARLQLYLTTLSSTIIALALAAQLPGLGADFRVFAIVLLPIVFLLGLVTLGRLNQLELEWRIYGQGMNRIRHYFTEVARGCSLGGRRSFIPHPPFRACRSPSRPCGAEGDLRG